MTRKIAETLMGKRMKGEIGYYKRLNRIERIINGVIVDTVLCTSVAVFIVYLLFFG